MTQLNEVIPPQIQEAFDKKYEEIGEDVWHDTGNDRIFYFGWMACEANCTKLLTEQDYKYNKQTNELIARHAEQLEVAAEFCRQYQIEIAQLKAENKRIGDYYMKINSMYWNDEIFVVKNGEGFYTDKFVDLFVEF